MHFLGTVFRGATTAVAEVSGPDGGCDEGGHGGVSNTLDEGTESLGLEVVVGVAMAAVGVLLAVVLSGLNMLGSAGVGFTGKEDDEVESLSEFIIDVVKFLDRHSKCTRTKLYRTFGSGFSDW